MVETHGFIAAIRRIMTCPPRGRAIHDYEFGGGVLRDDDSRRDRSADRGAIPLTLSGKISYNGGAVKSASMLDIVYLNTVCAGARREP